MANPLTPADIAALKVALNQTAEGRTMCAQGAACGFDLSGPEAVLIELQQRLATTLQTFAPKKVSPS